MSPEHNTEHDVVKLGIYNHIDERIASLQGWDLEITQLEPGTYECAQLNASTGDYRYVFMQHNRKVLNRACNSEPGFQFCFNLTEHSPPHHVDYSAEHPMICCVPSGQEVRVVVPGGFEGAALFISSERYHQLLERHFDAPFCCPPRHGLTFYHPDSDQHRQLCRTLLQIRTTFRNQVIASGGVDQHLREWLHNITEQQLIPQLLEVMANGNDRPLRRRPQRFLAALQLIFDNLDSPPNINELAKMLDTSPRNLQYLFKQHLGLSPKQFIKLYRLNIARRQLWQSRYSRGIVTDIANQLGYWHMGGFARDFKQLFHFNPREMLLADSQHLQTGLYATNTRVPAWEE